MTDQSPMTGQHGGEEAVGSPEPTAPAAAPAEEQAGQQAPDQQAQQPADQQAADQQRAVDEQAAVAEQEPAGEQVEPVQPADGGDPGDPDVRSDVHPDVHPDTVLAAERLSDLQRLQAEYVNYKRRVDRDRAVVQERAAQSVIEALLPVLDDISAAREHGDLAEGPFAAIADKLEATLGKFGLERYGAPGEEFDPTLHEALMHTAWPADGSVAPTGSTTVVQVLQPGYRAGDQVLRAARVAVADPE